ncbi:MAG: hypothetical protein PHC52_09780 [Syntrophales bacterium]|nr:hypothetical protein [Syntrophales bacterium]
MATKAIKGPYDSTSGFGKRVMMPGGIVAELWCITESADITNDGLTVPTTLTRLVSANGLCEFTASDAILPTKFSLCSGAGLMEVSLGEFAGATVHTNRVLYLQFYGW